MPANSSNSELSKNIQTMFYLDSLGLLKNLVTTRNKTNPTQIFSNLSYLDQHYMFPNIFKSKNKFIKKKKTECQVEFNLNQTNKDLLNTSHVPFTVSEGGNYKNEWDVSLAFYKDESGGGDKTCTETTLIWTFWKLEFTLIIVPGTWNDICWPAFFTYPALSSVRTENMS